MVFQWMVFQCILYFCKKKIVFVQTNTIQAVKSYFKERLQNHFSESELKFMFKEAVMARLNLTASEFVLSDSNLLSESDLLFFRSVVKRLLSNEPFQYVIGKTVFFGLEIATDSRALIPRPETEELVDWITQEFPQNSSLLIADICTGSGCIALALKSYFSNAQVFATDISQEALQLTQENAKQLNLSVTTLLSDAKMPDSALSDQLQHSDVWVSNPPYIPMKDKSEMLENVLTFEPHLALFVENEDPLIFYREIGKNALINLKAGGKLFFEIHEDLSLETAELLEGIGFVNIEMRKDLQGKMRMIKAEKP
jgi:release factor glutamine methyltransferase